MFHTLTVRICIVILCIYALAIFSKSAHASENQVYVSAYDKLIEYEDWDLDDLISYFQWAHISENAGY